MTCIQPVPPSEERYCLEIVYVASKTYFKILISLRIILLASLWMQPHSIHRIVKNMCSPLIGRKAQCANRERPGGIRRLSPTIHSTAKWARSCQTMWEAMGLMLKSWENHGQDFNSQPGASLQADGQETASSQTIFSSTSSMSRKTMALLLGEVGVRRKPTSLHCGSLMGS